MSRRRREVAPAVLDDVRARLAADPRAEGPGSAVRPDAVAAALLPPTTRRGDRRDTPALGARGVLDAVDVVHAHVAGAGPLQHLLEEPDVTDVLVNGPGRVWVDRGQGLRRVDVDVGDEPGLRALACRLAAMAGRRLDDACPYVDARLPGGVRLHAVLPPVSPEGTLLSLRVPRRRALSLTELVEVGTVPPSWAPLLTRLVTRRLSFLVSGGTGCGKTTVLGTLLGLADPDERVVLVEDAGELAPEHPHVVRLEARHGNAEGAGAVDLQDLVRQALRMRPDRLVVGECRGAEVRDLLAALNTGHEGGCGTVHANTAGDVPARLEALGALAGMDRPALASQAASALDAVLHLERSGPRRRVVELAVVRRDGSGDLEAVPALLAGADPSSPGAVGPAWPQLATRLDVERRWPP